MKFKQAALILMSFFVMVSSTASADELFSTPESKEKFLKQISVMVGRAWKEWQDAVVINDIDVQGSNGELRPGDMAEPVLTASSMMASYKRKGKGQDCIDCVKAATEALEHGMRSWQRGYQNRDILFPQGASCTYTMPPSNNVPVSLAAGKSTGDREMTAEALFSFMIYRAPNKNEDIKDMFRVISKAFADSFERWKRSCSIVDILASGGIAPQPAPMGTGPGPVRGAKGNGGKLVGSYVTSEMLYFKMRANLS